MSRQRDELKGRAPKTYALPVPAWRVENGQAAQSVEQVAVEVAVRVMLDGSPVAESSFTPCDIDDFAIGCLFSHHAIGGIADIGRIRTVRGENGLTIFAERSRGVKRASADAQPAEAAKPVPAAAVAQASRMLIEHQIMHQDTGATHAAAFFGADGTLRHVREDVGRHNAVDKLIGCMLAHNTDAADGFVHLSSRCALELVTKCARLGVRLVSTVSAPTTAVLRFADDEGITLAAFARDGRFTVYTHPEGISDIRLTGTTGTTGT